MAVILQYWRLKDSNFNRTGLHHGDLPEKFKVWKVWKV